MGVLISKRGALKLKSAERNAFGMLGIDSSFFPDDPPVSRTVRLFALRQPQCPVAPEVKESHLVPVALKGPHIKGEVWERLTASKSEPVLSSYARVQVRETGEERR